MANATPTLYYLDIGSLGRGEVVRYVQDVEFPLASHPDG